MGSFKLTRLTDAIDRANGLSGVSDFQREVDDMYAELGNDRPTYEGGYSAFAADGSSDLVRSLQPISLADDEMIAYESFFYSRKARKATKKAGDDDSEDDEGPGLKFTLVKRPRSFMIELFDQIADVTNSFNCFMYFMRDLMTQGRRLYANESDPKALAGIVQSLFTQSMK